MKISKELREILELGQHCGLDTVDEALSNAMLHQNVFHSPISPDVVMESALIMDSNIIDVLPQEQIGLTTEFTILK